jgi:hypothetical protein
MPSNGRPLDAASIQTLRDDLKHCFLATFNPDIHVKATEAKRTALQRAVRISQVDRETLACLAAMRDRERAALADKSFFEKFMASKNAFLEAIECDVAQEETEEVEEAMQTLNSLVETMQTMWVCLARYMRSVSDRYRFAYEDFKAAINKEIGRSRESVKELEIALVRSVLRWVFPALELNDALFYMFLVAAIHEGIEWDTIASIIQNLASEVHSKIEPAVRLQTTLDTLKNTNITGFFGGVIAFVESVFGRNFHDDVPVFDIESCFAPSPTIPVLLFSDAAHDVTLQLIQRAMHEGGADAFECISMCDSKDSIDRARQTFATAMNRGQLLLIEYSVPSQLSALFLNDTIVTLKGASVSPQFRLIINCKTTRFLSSQLLRHARHVTVESAPLMKPAILALYQKFGPILE